MREDKIEKKIKIIKPPANGVGSEWNDWGFKKFSSTKIFFSLNKFIKYLTK